MANWYPEGLASNSGIAIIEETGVTSDNGFKEGTVHVTVDGGALTAGGATAANQVTEIASLANLNNFGAGEYETVAASQTAQVLGSTGVAGDYLAGILVIPAVVACGLVTVLDGAVSIPVFVGGGTTALPSCIPFFIPLGIKARGAGFSITTGASVSCVCVGNFT